MIVYKPENHEYISEDNQKYISVSALYGQYKPAYDDEYWSTFKALEQMIPNFKEVKRTYPSEIVALKSLQAEVDQQKLYELKQSLKAKWKQTNKESTSRGNLFHKDAEKMAYIRGVIDNPFTKRQVKVIKLEKKKGFANHSTAKLSELEDGFYPELLLWNDEHKLAGQSDKVYISTYRGNRYVDIDDYKTNKEIKYEGFRRQTMLPPLDHLQNCNFIHYSLAISCYAWMLEQEGYKVRHTGFHHHNNLIKTKYLKEEVEHMLRVRRERLNPDTSI